MTTYIWKPIPGYEGLYAASNYGGIRSLPRRTVHYTGKIIWRGGKVLKGHVNPKGYLQVSLSAEGFTKTHLVHWLVAAAFHGPRPAGLIVRHLDGDQSNNHASNLAYGTPLENSQDMARHGTILRGASHGSSKLTLCQVREIRRQAHTKSQGQLAADFHMSNQQISNIVNHRQWKE